MEDASDSPEPAPAEDAAVPPTRPEPPDPEIEALLGFAPVVRRTRRHDGWLPDRQRGFIAALARLGNVDRAAHTVGRTASGAWKVRNSARAEPFADAWDQALALYHRRNPKPARIGRPSRGERLSLDAQEEETRAARAEAAAEKDERDERAIARAILKNYRLKLVAEREARLEGRIVEADFCVRQLTCIEVLLDLGSQGLDATDLLEAFRTETGESRCRLDVVATPMSLFLDRVRRDIWREKGEPERPPLAPLGDHRDGLATGPRTYFRSDRDGDLHAWEARRTRDHAIAAEAQRLWEEKARAEAEAWRQRENR